MGKWKYIGLFIIPLLIAFYGTENKKTAIGWQQVDDGLWFAFFDAHPKIPIGDSKILVVKINPNLYEFKLLSAKELKCKTKTIREWAEEYHLIAAVNAGMFQDDFLTNVGLMKNGDYFNNPTIHKKHFSVFAAQPLKPGLEPVAQIFDTDQKDIKSILSEYKIVIQNLRLIKRPGINRWPQKSARWSEVALGEDADGNILFIFLRSPYSMHDLNEMLLKLPIRLVAAQHLEGGPEASLYLKYGDRELVRVGSFETDFNQNDRNTSLWPLPNVLGVVKKN